MNLPDAFINDINKSLALNEQQLFFEALGDSTPVSIRMNPFKWKNDIPDLQVPWCPFGFYLDKRPKFTLDPSFHAGEYYVQEASSMFIYHILNQLPVSKKGLKVLDLCAAPGGKSTLISSWLGGNGLLVANEVIKGRAYTLKYNLSKEGHANVLVSNNDPKDFNNITEFFDIILVDAPCSGEGMFRKDPKSICEWSEENVQNCSSRQKSILTNVISSLKSGGYLIYSTCTYNDIENIENTDWLVSEHHFQSISINVPDAWGVCIKNGIKSIGYQFYPHKVKGEGFFAAVFKNPIGEDNSLIKREVRCKNLNLVEKNELYLIKDWVRVSNMTFLKDKAGTIHAIDDETENDIRYLENHLRLIYCGVSVGIINKNILIPDHSLALSPLLSDEFHTVSLNSESALLYLKKSLNQIDSDKKSWILATYNGNGLGFLKNLGNRINNYLPAEYRILMDLPQITS